MSSSIPIKGKRSRGYSTRSPIAPTTLPSSLSFKHDTGIQERERQEIFSFDPANLTAWLMEETLWNHLPEEMRKKLKTTQHAGATVLTSLKRLEQLEKNLPPEELYTSAELPTEPSSSSLHDTNAMELVAEKLANIDIIRAELPNRPKRSNSEAIFNCSPVASRPSCTTSQAAQDSSRSEKSSDTHSTDFISPAARLSPPSMMSPASPHEFFSPAVTPFELGDPRLPHLPTISRRDSELALTKSQSSTARRDSDIVSSMSHTTSSSFKLKVKAPKDPKLTAYHAELEQLRQKELVRLRHSQRPIDKLWQQVYHDDYEVSHDDALCHQFSTWWNATKAKIARLDEHIKAMCDGIHFSVGWSDTPGLDHRYAEQLAHSPPKSSQS